MLNVVSTFIRVKDDRRICIIYTAKLVTAIRSELTTTKIRTS